MTAILGISAFYHDAAAAVLVDGRIVAAAQEERFTRIKHDRSFPRHAIDFCLREAGLGSAQLDHVVFYEKPLLKFERLLETYLSVAPAGFLSFLRAMPVWLHEKLQLPRVMQEGLGGAYRRPFLYPEHHESHAASAFFPSPFEEAAILVLDGVGEWATGTIGRGVGNRIELCQEMRFPHSLGLLYSAFTYFCGFRVNSGEYKLMGLAPYGQPRYAALIREEMLDLKADGSFRLDLSYFNFCAGLTMTSRRFAALFGGPPRLPEGELTQREFDLAASIQQVTEEIVLRMARHAQALTGSRRLCLAGGVALNCVANGRLWREGPFDDIWIQPAAGDAGGALGAALLVWHQLLGQARQPQDPDTQRGSLLGPALTEAEIEQVLRQQGADYRRAASPDELYEEVAARIAAGQVVGWVQGRMEFGPRALGNRSILADARDPRMQSKLNRAIKFRESFRPFAPAVLQERADEFFDLDGNPHGRAGVPPAAYMLLVAPVRPAKRAPSGAAGARGLERVHEVRSVVPAVTHVDHSARVQTVDADRNPRLAGLLRAFAELTGCPMVINTSFNIRGEPIVGTAADAYRCFRATDMDVLVLGDFIVQKRHDMPDTREAAAALLARYGND